LPVAVDLALQGIVMANHSFKFAGERVGLVVRGKFSHEDRPSVFKQHADCILSNGAPVGFFGEGVGGESSNAVGLRMSGQVYDYKEMQRKRAWYVSQSLARTGEVVSTVLILQVSPATATEFDSFWKGLNKARTEFNFVGGNCSTHASQAFFDAGILAGGIRGLDTPNRLYHQLYRQYEGRCKSLSGFVGFTPSESGYLLQVQTWGD
jgi:hypothetical protein